MNNLFVNIWNSLKTLLAALKQRFLVHPSEVVKTVVETKVEEVKADTVAVVDKVEAVPAIVAADVEHVAQEVIADVPKVV